MKKKKDSGYIAVLGKRFTDMRSKPIFKAGNTSADCLGLNSSYPHKPAPCLPGVLICSTSNHNRHFRTSLPVAAIHTCVTARSLFRSWKRRKLSLPKGGSPIYRHMFTRPDREMLSIVSSSWRGDKRNQHLSIEETDGICHLVSKKIEDITV